MSEIKRYSCSGDWGYEADPSENCGGGCVKFEDYQALQKRVEELQTENAGLREAMQNLKEELEYDFTNWNLVKKPFLDCLNKDSLSKSVSSELAALRKVEVAAREIVKENEGLVFDDKPCFMDLERAVKAYDELKK